MIPEVSQKSEKQLIESTLLGIGFRTISNQDRMLPEGEYWIHIRRVEK